MPSPPGRWCLVALVLLVGEHATSYLCTTATRHQCRRPPLAYAPTTMTRSPRGEARRRPPTTASAPPPYGFATTTVSRDAVVAVAETELARPPACRSGARGASARSKARTTIASPLASLAPPIASARLPARRARLWSDGGDAAMPLLVTATIRHDEVVTNARNCCSEGVPGCAIRVQRQLDFLPVGTSEGPLLPPAAGNS